MLESLFQHTQDLPGERLVTVVAEGENGYNLTGTLRELRAYQPPPLGQLWEYRMLVCDSLRISVSDFDEQGAKGWELIGVNWDDKRAFVVFKRPKQNIPAHICAGCGATL